MVSKKCQRVRKTHRKREKKNVAYVEHCTHAASYKTPEGEPPQEITSRMPIMCSIKGFDTGKPPQERNLRENTPLFTTHVQSRGLSQSLPSLSCHLLQVPSPHLWVRPAEMPNSCKSSTKFLSIQAGSISKSQVA